jgi:hypothetical protein
MRQPNPILLNLRRVVMALSAALIAWVSPMSYSAAPTSAIAAEQAR